MPSVKGQFLIATAELLDPNFEQAVVLILKHDTDGAFGLIVNAPLTLSVSDALGTSVEAAQDVDVPLHRGGPCQAELLLVLHGGAVGHEVLPGVRIIQQREDIERVMSEHESIGNRVRYLLGSAQWAPDQLESELAEGSWLTVPATSEDVFADAPEQWERLTTKAGLTKFIPPDQIPDEPGLN